MKSTRNAASESTPGEDLGVLRRRLVGLATRALGDVTVMHDAPLASAAGAPCIGMYLLAFEPAAAAARQAQVLQFNARFLVTVRDADAAAGADALAALLFAALDEPALEVGLEPLPAAAWSAFGVPPQPCFTLTAPVRRQRGIEPAPPVREAVLRLQPARLRLEREGSEPAPHIDPPPSLS